MEIKYLDVPAIYNAIEDTKSRRNQNDLYQRQTQQMDDAKKAEAERAGDEDLYAAGDWIMKAPEADRPAMFKQAQDYYKSIGADLSGITLENLPLEMSRLGAKIGKEAPDPYKAASPLGKLRADFDAGLMSPEQYKAGVAKANKQAGPLVTVNTGDQPQTGPMTGPQAGKRTSTSLDTEEQSTTNVAEIEHTLDELSKVDYATGIPGWAIDELGGVIAQAPFVGSALAEKMGTEKVAKVRSNLQSLVARMVSTYTGEESGRITKEELAISQAASKAKDPKADMTQIVGALNSIREIELRVIARENMKRDNIPDLTSSIGREKYVDDLRKLYPNESDAKLVDRLIEAMQTYKIHSSYKKYDPR